MSQYNFISRATMDSNSNNNESNQALFITPIGHLVSCKKTDSRLHNFIKGNLLL